MFLLVLSMAAELISLYPYQRTNAQYGYMQINFTDLSPRKDAYYQQLRRPIRYRDPQQRLIPVGYINVRKRTVTMSA